MTRQPQRLLPPLYLITNRRIATPDLHHALEAALRAGVRLIQLREKDLSTAELKILAEKILKRTQHYGAKLLLNGNPELVSAIGADGVQLGVNSCNVLSARQILGPQALIGYSAHSCSEVEEAAAQGADFVTFSPIYYTASKSQYGPPQGLSALRKLCRTASLPVYALGGITAERVCDVLDAGACGVALISAVFSAPDTRKAAQELLHAIASDNARLREYS